MRDATMEAYALSQGITISTHAPHAGRDADPRLSLTEQMKFLLTRPMRDATKGWLFPLYRTEFLLTRPMRDATNSCHPNGYNMTNFYSRAPCGTRRIQH